jgi:prepilin-type N-terminal cleavage/methylation domain-containing protein
MTLITGQNDRYRPCRIGGFTLLELILVLILISTLLAIAAPSLRGFFASQKAQDTTRQLLALTRWARSHAAAEGTVYRLNADTTANAYWLTAQQEGTFSKLACDLGKMFYLAEGLNISLTTQNGQSVSYVQFYPDGRNDQAVIKITGKRGEIYTITSPSVTEGFIIAD